MLSLTPGAADKGVLYFYPMSWLPQPLCDKALTPCLDQYISKASVTDKNPGLKHHMAVCIKYKSKQINSLEIC